LPEVINGFSRSSSPAALPTATITASIFGCSAGIATFGD
jgi:hypothetical protein